MKLFDLHQCAVSGSVYHRRYQKRQLLAKAGVAVPARVDLELGKYLNNRGAKKLMFKPEHEIKDPFAGK